MNAGICSPEENASVPGERPMITNAVACGITRHACSTSCAML